MRIGILSGAVKNAGDYLIVNRGKELIEKVFGKSEFITFNRLESLEEKLDDLNACKVLFLVGGPLFLEKIYPEYMPLVDDLSRIKPPIFTLGNGWYGKNNLPETIYLNYKFSDNTKRFLERIESDSVSGISCRDWYTWRLLKNNGYLNVRMTGCPAWYAVGEQIKVQHAKSIKKINISDPAYTMNISKAKMLISFLRIKYPNSEICFLFHRGIVTDGEKGKEVVSLLECLESKNIEYRDISKRADGFKEYDECDLHIGFRVHAHIYNISIHNYSILIEEDARGIGVNEALLQLGVHPYLYEYNNEKVTLRDNEFFINECNDLLDILEETNGSQFEDAYKRIDRTYLTMIDYLNKIKASIL